MRARAYVLIWKTRHHVSRVTSARVRWSTAMPYFPSGPCRHRGCPERAEHDGFCERHRRERNRQYNRERRSDPNRDDRFYDSAEWKRLRAAKLAADPLCETCREQGRIVEANTVDHKIPIRRGGERLDWNNLQSQCTPCHSRKSAQEGSRW